MTFTLTRSFKIKSCIKIEINLIFYFHTSLWCLKRFYEGLGKTFWDTTKKSENENLRFFTKTQEKSSFVHFIPVFPSILMFRDIPVYWSALKWRDTTQPVFTCSKSTMGNQNNVVNLFNVNNNDTRTTSVLESLLNKVTGELY